MKCAKKLDLSDQALHRLVNGRMAVDKTLAGKLSQLTGTGAGYWLNLQKAYQSAKIVHEMAGSNKNLSYSI